MELKPQDIVVALKIGVLHKPASYAVLGKSLGISASEAHGAVQRLIASGLANPESRDIHKARLKDFIIHGVPVAFPAKAGEMTRGMPTAWAAPVMAGRIAQVSGSTVPVWPAPEGKVRGVAVEPLYGSVVFAATNDSVLYDLLALVDAIRLGRARDRKIAEEELTLRLRNHD